MGKDRRGTKILKADTAADLQQQEGGISIPEATFSEIGQGHAAGFELADEYAKKIQGMVDEAITVIETVKKIPDFNANLSVELALSCASLRAITSDPRADELHLECDEEPVSDKHIEAFHRILFSLIYFFVDLFQKALGKDNCMSEAIEVQPQPILGLGQIDLAKGPLGLVDQCSSTTKKTAKRALFSVNSRKLQSF